ncbi:hypothetical protein ACFLX9_03755 [Chloroflexota bacterium]
MNLWPFLKERARHFSKEFREELLSKFGVESEAADSMRYVTKRSRFGGLPAKLVCVFDQATVPDAKLVACTYDGMMDRKESLLFSGHILSGLYQTTGKAFVYLEDPRPS